MKKIYPHFARLDGRPEAPFVCANFYLVHPSDKESYLVNFAIMSYGSSRIVQQTHFDIHSQRLQSTIVVVNSNFRFQVCYRNRVVCETNGFCEFSKIYTFCLDKFK